MFQGGECFYETNMTDEQWNSFMGLDEWPEEEGECNE
jgi:hypothetical protein